MKAESFLEFLNAQGGQIALSSFIVHLLLASLTSWLLSRFYIRFGRTLSNREAFGKNFVLLTMTTVMIITIVKSSLALSLGLVGALSIVRFRAAIKEPEELSYLFLAISLGLGFGAEQAAVTLAAFGVILLILALKHYVRATEETPNLFLTVTSTHPHKLSLGELTAILHEFGTETQLKRLDETAEVMEAALKVRFVNTAKLQSFNDKIRSTHPQAHLSYLDDRGLGA